MPFLQSMDYVINKVKSSQCKRIAVAAIPKELLTQYSKAIRAGELRVGWFFTTPWGTPLLSAEKYVFLPGIKDEDLQGFAKHAAILPKEFSL